MRCLSCNAALTDFEATRKTLKTEEFLDLCNNCYYTISDDVLTIDRADLDDGEEVDDGCIDYDLDNEEQV
jgi:hypothetical protein